MKRNSFIGLMAMAVLLLCGITAEAHEFILMPVRLDAEPGYLIRAVLVFGVN
ncbi:MAG: hypothetical protein HC887_10330 [Desulfobacteraceae bacterium]|nr:hypothetical protein [Desulfobacteraceae bacterium]